MGTLFTSASRRAAYAPNPSPGGAGGDWDRVHVERIEMERAEPPAVLACVRVDLFLGRLLPVDVDVELDIESDAESALPEMTPERMWSAHSYQNGSYLFEAHVPDARLACARHVSVNVHPRDRGHAGRSLVKITPSSELRRVAPPESRGDPHPAARPVNGVAAPELPSFRDDLGP